MPGGPTCAPFCGCSLTNDCSDPFACPSLQCPDAGSENLCPQGLVCMEATPCEGCGVACPVSFACLPPPPELERGDRPGAAQGNDAEAGLSRMKDEQVECTLAEKTWEDDDKCVEWN
jgi:hypothetical protein